MWAASKFTPNSGNSSFKCEDNPDPSRRNTREGAETRRGALPIKCCKCGVDKSITEFYVKDRGTGRKDTTCKTCRKHGERERHTGWSNAMVIDAFAKQRGRCGICQRRLYLDRFRGFHADHCHTTGRPRGLLCHHCNTGIGLFRDDPIVLARAIEWAKGIVQSPEQSGSGDDIPALRPDLGWISYAGE